MASVDWSNVRDRLARFGQEHLLQFLDELGEREKAELYKDISEIDLRLVLTVTTIKPPSSAERGTA